MEGGDTERLGRVEAMAEAILGLWFESHNESIRRLAEMTDQSHRRAEMRRAMAPLLRLAVEQRQRVILIAQSFGMTLPALVDVPAWVFPHAEIDT